ncbi:hypothetical protein COY13_03030 [Candidatus Roizmanbacteria bacterium CG_4_10_14_0_2_um_filter_36_35]|uniref:Uncharacterized protein n=4 Tax=Candidatus Roizmaniibacteriota TaxID=1752723 RepID=A0A2M7BVK2_9BACT|nr:MAG: hypothetical protein COV86_00185 [Candidatus Roizmanbacteria bacterium CG11_big_fil_rev_8_21_14_0_20_35_14]PIV10569.1 MAG: hypothetical protein COS50_04930 [Candidatus Roizmanbacteria bacterium CG03_land_8_20_14_0_80_35_26]PIZ67483.1 MAG: hypothetical protein COY13_03030 [Candidatus Roizmanbacteria bacterium CG_4_10_14_0_2_um_filter_36_35]PJC32852.1 MAG: hypothetical protein CO049_01635 [Candidatus Roizmanbacteria bacterium CG_4_9_14_0_2_um_filter_36_12]PJC81038.1 MAG: hypothetical prot
MIDSTFLAALINSLLLNFFGLAFSGKPITILSSPVFLFNLFSNSIIFLVIFNYLNKYINQKSNFSYNKNNGAIY